MVAQQWRMALELAWSSYCAGTTPVGAVVLRADGSVAAAGRGRRYEPPAQDGQLAHCHIAHAEINALALLPPHRHYDDHVLLTTLEPCCMCVGAAVQSTLTSVRFAGRDPYGGASSMQITTPQGRRRPLRVAGPEPGMTGLLAELLHVSWLAQEHPGPPLEAQRSLGRSYELGTDAVTVDALRRLAAAGAPLADALAVAASSAA